jgi:hypothetical protein
MKKGIRMDAFHKSIFLESAETKERLLCAGMPSYQPAFWVFKGFNKIDNNK